MISGALRRVLLRIGGLAGGRRHERDMEEELDAHLRAHVDDHVSSGMAPDQARRAALLELGGLAMTRDLYREQRRFMWLDDLARDLSYTARTLRRSPGFAATAILIVALGIGATAASFTLLDYVILRPLPYAQPDRLVNLYQTALTRNITRLEVTPLNLTDWRVMNRSFSSMGAFVAGPSTLTGHGEPARVQGSLMSSDVLTTLGVQAIAGRSFTADDDREGSANVALLREDFASTLFGDARAALGQALTLDGQPSVVVGILPNRMAVPSRDTVFWRPLHYSVLGNSRTNIILSVIARLRPGVSVREAQADMARVTSQLQRDYPKENDDVGAAVVPMRDDISPQSRMLVLAVFGAALCLMLIACSNLASLLLARAAARAQELAVRVAIGAGRGRLLRQLLTESVALAVAGGALGCGLAVVAVPLLGRLVPNALPVNADPQVDVRVLAFTGLVTVVTSLAFGVGPAIRSWRDASPQALRSRPGFGAGDRLRSVLVLAEVAGAVTLLVGAGLLVQALWRVRAVDTGFRHDGLLTMQTALPLGKYRAPADRKAFYDRVLADVHALPGVTSAAYTTGLPLTFGGGIFSAMLPGMEENAPGTPRASIRFVTPEFFTALHVPLKRGRYLSGTDGANSPFVAVVSESLARRLWPGQDAIGRQFRMYRTDRTVVGVVGDIVVRGLERTSEPQVYASPEQLVPFSVFYAPRDLIIRASGDPLRLAPDVRRIVNRIDPAQPIANVKLFDDIFEQQTSSRRDQLVVLGCFTGVAFLLAAVGIHGLLSFIVTARTRELGVRVALGATRRSILLLFVRQGLVLGAAGIAVAVPVAYAAARGMSALLFGVEPGNQIVYAAAALTALVTTLAGTLRPALRASAVDPAIAMRAE